MEEADKVSSSAPDEAPLEIAVNEAAAVGHQTQTDAEEEMTEKTRSLQTNEVTSSPQFTEETSSPSPHISEETSSPSPHIAEETSSPSTQISEETSSPSTHISEETSSPSPHISEETSSTQISEETSSTQISEETSSPQISEETSSPSPQSTEVTSSSQPAEVVVTPDAAEEDSVTAAEVNHTSTEAEVTSTSQADPVITEAAVTPETAEESVTPSVTEAVTPEATEVTETSCTEATEARAPPASAARVTPAPEVSSSCAAQTDSDLSSAAREEEEEKHPLTLHPSASHDPDPPAPAVAPELFQTPSVLELLLWRDVRSSALVFGSSLFLLLSLTCCSIISVLSYAALALLSLTLSYRIYKGVLQAVQKSDEGHPFKWLLEKDMALSGEAVQRHSEVALSRIDGALKEMRRLFLVEDLIDSLKFAVLLWVFTYVGSWFNGLTLLILGLVGAFSGPIAYEKHQTQIDQQISALNSQMKDVWGKIQAKVPGAKKKPE